MVKAVKTAHVVPVGGSNQGPVQFIGKVFNQETKEFDILEDGVRLQFHPEYIKHLKEGALLPLTEETAVKAGLPFAAVLNAKKASLGDKLNG